MDLHAHSGRSPVLVTVPSGHAVAQHLTMRLVRDRTLATTDAERRSFVRLMLSLGGGELGVLAFGLADTHVHVLAAASVTQSVELARRIKIALQQRLPLGGTPFEPTRLRSVEDVHHLANVLPHVLDQPARHARALDPCFEGSSLLELLGLRVADGGRLQRLVRSFVPRLEPGSLLPLLGVDLADFASIDYARLADAAAAAFALASLKGNGAGAARARRAAVHAAHGLAAAEVAALLGVCVSLVRAARHVEVPRAEVDAVRLQLRLRTAVGMRAR